MAELQLHRFDGKDQLDQQLAIDVGQRLRAAIKEKGSACLVVSGGSTPLNFFARLSAQPLDWDKVLITLADERWVSPTDVDSNERMLRQHLLINKAKAARFISLKRDADTAVMAEAAMDKEIASLPEFDVVILGVGLDGHTASLFPCSDEIEQGLDVTSSRACLAVHPKTAAHERMSMTLPRLMRSQQLIVHITGKDKKAVLDKAIADKSDSKAPIAVVVQKHSATVELYWAE